MSSSRHSLTQKTGWLHKRGGRIQTWHKRWFVLNGDLLFYYKSSQDSRPTGTIPLAGNEVIRHQDDSRQMHSYKFEIVAGSGRSYITSTHDSYLISAESSEDADDWVASIKRVLHEPYGGGMFRRSLEKTMAVEARLGGEYIPILVHRCAKFILEHGLKETGIFRLPGQSSRVQALKDIYDHGSQADIPSSEDVHTVASLLKLYLRELPEPVIPYEMVDEALSVAKLFSDQKNEKGMTEIRKLLAKLPIVNYNLLKYLSRFLHNIARSSDENKMNHSNLATVFGPNILRAKSPEPINLIESSNASANFVCALIIGQEQLFPVTSDEKPPKRLSIVNLAEQLTFSHKPGGSMFVKSVSPKPENRARLGSVPTRFVPLSPDSKQKIKFNGPLDSPRRAKKFNALSVFDPGSSNGFSDTRSGRVSPLIMSPPRLDDDDDDDDNSSHSPPYDRLGDNKSGILIDDSNVSSIVSNNKLLQNEEEKRERSETNGTVSPDLLVNSIAKEMESLERQLEVLQRSNSKQKRQTQLWKSRYQQERRARLAAEERITDLESLVEKTFQQFALDDSEDEDYEDDDSISGDSLRETSLGNELNCLTGSDQIPNPIPNHVRHIRSNSTYFN